jgi:polyisoprenoid-binding protein YceI
VDGKPTEVNGELTLRGVTKPVSLTIRTFKCMPHPMNKKEFCGADAAATIDREDFGMSFGKNFGFDMDVKLNIQVETEAG